MNRFRNARTRLAGGGVRGHVPEAPRFRSAGAGEGRRRRTRPAPAPGDPPGAGGAPLHRLVRSAGRRRLPIHPHIGRRQRARDRRGVPGHQQRTGLHSRRTVSREYSLRRGYHPITCALVQRNRRCDPRGVVRGAGAEADRSRRTLRATPFVLDPSLAPKSARDARRHLPPRPRYPAGSPARAPRPRPRDSPKCCAALHRFPAADQGDRCCRDTPEYHRTTPAEGCRHAGGGLPPRGDSGPVRIIEACRRRRPLLRHRHPAPALSRRRSNGPERVSRRRVDSTLLHDRRRARASVGAG